MIECRKEAHFLPKGFVSILFVLTRQEADCIMFQSLHGVL